MLGSDIDTKILRNSKHNIDWSKRPRKGHSSFSHQISPNQIKMTQASLDQAVECIDTNVMTKTCNVPSSQDKKRIKKLIDNSRLRRIKNVV
jgi:hypothetical protein